VAGGADHVLDAALTTRVQAVVVRVSRWFGNASLVIEKRRCLVTRERSGLVWDDTPKTTC
jgi:hypothetical protein